MGSKPVTVSTPSAAGTLLAKRKAKQGILVLQDEAEVKPSDKIFVEIFNIV